MTKQNKDFYAYLLKLQKQWLDTSLESTYTNVDQQISDREYTSKLHEWLARNYARIIEAGIEAPPRREE